MLKKSYELHMQKHKSVILINNISNTYGQYTPDWNSLDSRPLPTWYDEAKIGCNGAGCLSFLIWSQREKLRLLL